MSFTRSSAEEIRLAEALVRDTADEIDRLRQAGKNVHVIWDVDFVLTSGRSDDAFALLNYDLKRYFSYEERLTISRLEDGPWLWLAVQCSRLQNSQDIVTARSSFLAFRAMLLCLAWQLPIRWQLYLGHQPKTESYRIILETFKKDESWHVYMVDDAEKHVNAFSEVVRSLGMESRARAIRAPQIRLYSESELKEHLDRVLAASGSDVVSVPHERPGHPPFKVLPGGPDFVRSALTEENFDLSLAHSVAPLRDILENQLREVMPGAEPTPAMLDYVRGVTLESAMEFGNWIEASIDGVLPPKK